MKPPVLLRIYFRGQLQGVKQFTGGQIVFGASEESQVPLVGSDIGPVHALIEERESGYFLSDLGSESGTLRNGSKVLDERLESGDEIKIGEYKIQFFIGVPKPAGPPSPPPAAPPQVTPPVKPSLEVKAQVDVKADVKPAKSAKATKPAAPPEVPPVPPVPPTPTPTPVAERPPLQKAAPAKAPTPTAAPTPGKRAAAQAGASKSKSFGTMAPPSAFRDASEIIRPSKGTLVEVIVTWRERVIAARHFKEAGEIFIGADSSCDLLVPILGPGSKIPVVQLRGLAAVRFSTDMSGELSNEKSSMTLKEVVGSGRGRQVGSVYEVDLQQGEMMRLGIQGNLVSIFVRYVPETPKPVVAPVLDLSASEATGVILSVVVAAIWGLYMALYTPKSLQDEALIEEPMRKATVVFKMPKKQIVEVKEEPPEPPKEKKVVQIVEKKRETTKPAVESPGKSGQAGEVAPSPAPPKPNQVVSVKPGGAIKTAPKEGAAPKSVKPDPTKVGLLGVFGSKGAQSTLDKTFSGSGELQGMAGESTGFAGNAENRAGDSLGTKLRDTGGGGKGTATVGIAGVGTKGRGTGGYGYGTGGIGSKGSVDIDIGGQEAEFTGTIDREAIRRIVLANRSAIRSCYDRALQRKPDLYGKVVIEWDIEEKGRVTQGRVKSNSLADDGGVARCVLGVIKSLRFPEPPPDQIGRVSYPFMFSSQ